MHRRTGPTWLTPAYTSGRVTVVLQGQQMLADSSDDDETEDEEEAPSTAHTDGEGEYR